jgi:cell division protein FtsW
VNAPLLVAQLLLLALGTVGVAAFDPDIIGKHLITGLVGVALTVLVAHMRPQGFIKYGHYLWALAIVCLVVTLLIGSGPNGVRRAIDLGPFEFQPAEFAKLALIAYLASFFTRRGVRYKLAGPVAVIGLTAFLVMVAPSLSAGSFMFVLSLAVMFASGVGLFRILSIIVFAGAGAVAASGLYADKFPYVLERIEGFSKTKAGSANVLAEGYQLRQSVKTLERAGIWGLGPDAPMPRVPAGSTDMIIISVGHSLGLIGVVVVIACFAIVLTRGLIASNLVSEEEDGYGRDLYSERHGAAVLAAGATILIVGEALINLSVAVGLIPNTGMILPMMSDGGSGMLATGIAFGWIHAALRLRHRRLPAFPRGAIGDRLFPLEGPRA